MLMLRVLSTKVFAQLKGCISTNTTQKNMTKREQISELNSLLLMMLPHPSNTLGSEFADRISGLIKVVSAMRDEAREEKPKEHKAKDVSNKVIMPVRECVFFDLKDGKYTTENGIEITTEMLVEYPHQITENWSFIILD